MKEKTLARGPDHGHVRTPGTTAKIATGCVPTLEAILFVLQGIDRESIDDPDGWWDTSDGARFGAGILLRIRRLFEQDVQL